ncbi:MULTISPECIES: hypothetical protein [unclassified Novosphingobium]|uniref:hypothetical protein n=1 Tax=unclassified Novosphingobium TaxID=2644732 RepID=UPI000D2F8CEA|nr:MULTISPECIES: hypothetical protein [unclassified Novosphingobium]PTR05689.1 hypothetical protein C8K11_12719 [Novosphingobium sp. GV055]PUA94257.1 hypothetical protein C8K12_12719 [Novosphingobium sp. GV061]PUB12360.1 hypothetical protein C8K14_12719 [Novosphingobium sp. GV079]PUB37274.1 hypothetical protein C8K10_12719 [Novosphingobium sp. GV027]
MPDFITPAQPWNTSGAMPRPLQSPMAQDPLADAMRRERDAQTRRNIVEAQAPDQVAQATALARQMGAMPADVEGMVGEAEKALRANNFGKLIDQHPTIGEWAAGDPRSAVAASDDTKSLGILGSAWDMLKKLPGRIGAGTFDAAAGLREFTDTLVLPADYLNYGFDAVATTVLQQAGLRAGYDPDKAFAQQQAWRAAGRQQLRNEAASIRQNAIGNNFWTESALSGMESIPLTVAAAMTRNPELATAIPATSVGGNAYAKGKAKGLSGASALTYAMTQGGTEYITEKMPASHLVEALVQKTPVGKAILGQLVHEIPGEQIATVVQDLSDWASVNPDQTFGDYLRERPQAALATLIGTVAATGAQTGGAVLMDRAAQKAAERFQRPAAEAARAAQDGQALNLMAKAAEGSALRQRDPEAYAALLRVASDNGHIPQQVYVPAEAITAYQQSDSYNQFDDPLADYQSQIAEAQATGGDVVLPSDFALTALPGTPAWAAIKDDIRLRPGGMSLREAQAFQEDHAQRVSEVEQAFQDGIKPTLPDLYHGGREGMTVNDIAIIRTDGQKQGKKGRVYGGFYATGKLDEAQGYADMGEGGGKVYRVDLAPGATVENREGDITRLTPETIDEYRARGVDVVVGKDPRGRTEYAVINKDAIKGLSDPQAREASIDQRAAMVDARTQELQNAGIPARMAGIYAELDVLRAAVRAERNGRPLDPKDFGSTIRAVLPERLAEIQRADQWDTVIHAMRKRAPAEIPQGKTLLEWINDRGGVNDVGGDLKAMGLDRWHMNDKGKKPVPIKGRRQIIRAYDPRQAEMAGAISGNGEYGLDTTLSTAIDEGYFPELQAAQFEAGPSTIDQNQLLDAIRAELAGKPRYAEAPKIDPARAAADDLRAMLEDTGRDPDAMTDAEIRAAIKDYAAGAQSQGYEQATDARIESVAHAIDELSSGSSEAVVHDLRPDLKQFGGDADVHLVMGDNKKGIAHILAQRSPDVLGNVLRAVAIGTDVSYQEAKRTVRISHNGYTAVLSLDEHGKTKTWLLTGWEDDRPDAKGKVGTKSPATQDAPTFSRDELGASRSALISASRELRQGSEGGPRGRFIPGQNGRGGTIELFQSRNPSTLIHEFGHQWLEELRADAMHSEASDQLRSDWETVKAWFASLGYPLADDGAIPVEAHEYWARGIERYLMEGNAPSTGLARLFETVRGWMLAIYRKVDALRSPISPEIRQVFDRMLATDDEITAQRNALSMQPAISDPKAMGMTGAEFDAYTQMAQGARDKANADLLAKAMAAIRRQRTKAWNDERAAARADEAERLDAAPLLKSLRMMRDTPIDREWLEDRFGRDVLDLLPKQVPPIHKLGGANPDALAEMAGFDSAQQMIEVLIGAQRQHVEAKASGDARGLRQRMIDNAADAEMQRRHGDDPLSDGSIEEEAIAAVNNDLAGDLLATELRYLGRRAGKQATPYQVARAWARQTVRGGVIVEQASLAAIQRHTKAVAKAGREAEKAILAGKMDEAFAAKQRQLLSSALLSESKAAYDEVSRAHDRLAAIAKRRTMKSVDQDYLEQAHALLDAVQLGPRSQKSIERQGKWETWAAQQEADGVDVVVPRSFEATLRGTHWSRLTVENLLGLNDAVEQVMHLGRLKQTLLDNQEQREWDDIFKEAVQAAANIQGAPPRDLTDPSVLEAIKANALALDASLLKMETVFDWLDGGDPNGVFNRIAFRPIAEAQDRENAMLADYYGRIKALFEAVPAEDAARWRDKMEMPWTDVATGGPMRMERSKVIAMALNIGNAGNFQRLADGYRINPGAIENYLNDTLTAGEWQFVQSVWDTIDMLWPMIEGLERRVNGVAPEKIEPRAFDTPHGPMRGGYYPAIYDTTRDYRAEERGGKESDLLGANYTKATTRARATKERAEKVKAPILLDLGVINRHLGEVIHDITHREAVIQANRFLTSERVSRAVDAALGPEIRKQFRPWVKFVANSWAMERAGNEGFGKWLGKLRANVTVVGMGLRATTMLTQIAGYSNSVEVVGAGPMAKAIAQFSASPIETAQFALERSGELRARMDTLDRDIRNQINAMATVNPVGKLARQALDAKRFMFHGIGYMDRVVSVPTWMAGYSNAIATGATEADAIYAGDKAVRQSQGSGSPKDMAAIVRGTGKWGEATKLFTMFYSYFSAQYQRQRTLARDAGGADARRSRNLPKLTARAFFLLVVPPLLTELIKAGVTGGGGPDDDEWWSEWISRKMLANAIGPIPLARDVFEPTWNAVAGNRVFSASLTPMQRAADSLAQAGRDVGKLARGQETKHATKDVLETTGYLTGLVPGQVASATQFLVDVGQGNADPQSVGDWIEGLTTGKVKDE